MFWQRAEPGVPQAADEWFTPGRFAALLAALIFVAYPEVVIGLRTFYHRDFAVFGYPLAYYHRASFWRGEVPLWNALNDCGLPFLAQWNTMTLYPLSLFYLLLPLSWSLGVFCLLHLFFAGLGMYFLAHRWTGNRFAAAFAGLAFSFNALMLNCLMWPNNISALGWLPWLVLWAERGWREGGRWLLLGVLAGAMQMLSGAPEVILLSWALVAALLAGQIVLDSEDRVRRCRRFLLIVLWVAGLGAAQLLPFMDLLAHSQRDKAFADSLWSMPAWGWANYLVPLFRNFSTPEGYVQPEQYWIPSYYLGVTVTALALLACTLARQPRIALTAAVTVFCLLLALGNHGLIYSVAKRVVPGLGFMRYPIKFVLLPTFLLPLLAAIALSRFLAIKPAERPEWRRKIVWLGAGLLGLVGVLCWTAAKYPFTGASAVVALQSGISRGAFLVVGLSGVIALCHFERPSLQRLARIALLLILWLDVMTAGPRPNPTVARWVYEPNLVRKELRLEPAPAIGQSRTLLNAEAEGNLLYASLTNAADAVVYVRLALYADANLLDDMPKVVGMYSIFFRELGDVFGCLYSGGGTNSPAGLADFLAVSHINSPGKATHWDLRPTWQPMITAGQKPLFASATATLQALGATDFKPQEAVFLPLEDRQRLAVANSSRVKVTVQKFSAHRIELEAEAVEPALVVVAQSFYKNWRARLDGQPTRLLRANHAFQAVEIPAGRHLVVLAYQDNFFRCGALVSVFLAVIWVVLWLRRRSLPSTLN
jgi:hypothetical protein